MFLEQRVALCFLFESPGLAVELEQLRFGRQVLEIPVSGNTVIILSTSAHKVSRIETSLGKHPHCLFPAQVRTLTSQQTHGGFNIYSKGESW